MTPVGAPSKPLAVASFGLIVKRRQLAGSSIGGIRKTQEMLDFCGEKGIPADIELIRIQQINEAYERLLKSDVKYRFVIDMHPFGESGILVVWTHDESLPSFRHACDTTGGIRASSSRGIASGGTPAGNAAIPLKLKSVEQLENDALWIRYEVVQS